MKKAIKKSAALLLAFILAFSALITQAAAADSEHGSMVSLSAAAQNSVVEGTGGSLQYSSGTDSFYYDYNISSFNPMFTVTYEDGYTLSGTQDELNSNYGLYAWYTSAQNFSPWTVGINTTTAYLGNLSCELSCAVTESEVESISAIASTTVIENTDGYFSGDIYYYFVDAFSPEYTVTLKDGSVLSGREWEIENAYEGIEIEYNHKQHQTPWGLGANTAYACAGGKICEFTCNVVESPIESISAVAQKEVIENTGGYLSNGWNQETEEYESYLNYNVDSFDPLYTVTFKDGGVFEGSHSEVNDYLSQRYPLYSALRLNVYNSQSLSRPWQLGANAAEVTVADKRCELICTVIESPYESISVEAGKSLRMGIDGYADYDGNFYYFIYDFEPIVTVTRKDGSVLSGSPEEIYAQTGCDVTFYDVNLWSNNIGKHSVTANFAGLSCSFECEIVSNGIESISAVVEPITEQGKGIMQNGIFYYDASEFTAEITINYTSGKSEKAYYNSEFCYFRGKPITILNPYIGWDEKSYSLGEGNTVTFSYLGHSCEAEVELLNNPALDYKYIEQNGAAYITHYIGDATQIEIPESFGSLPVKGIISLNTDSYEGSALTAVIIPDSVISIAEGAFWSCPALKNIRIGSGAQYISPATFAVCTELSQIIVSDNNPYYCDIWGVLYSKAKTALIAYPLGMGPSYTIPSGVTDISAISRGEYSEVDFSFASGNSAFITVDGVTYSRDMTTVIKCDSSASGEYIMPESVTTIADYAFRNSQFTSVEFSDKVTDIAYMAFSDCSSLKAVSLPSSLKTISKYAFSGTSLEALELPESTEIIAFGAFSGVPLKALRLNEGLTAIDQSAFSGSDITELTLPDSLSELGDGAFSCNDYLAEISFGSGALTIGASAFSSCYSLASLDLSGGEKYIGESAFSHCYALTEISIPKNVKSVGAAAFFDCESLTSVTIESDLTEIAYQAFSGCPIDSLNVSGRVEVIGNEAFSGTAFEKLVIPDTVTQIAYGAFFYCDSLAEIEIPDKVIKINSYAFEGTAWYKSRPDGNVYLGKILYDYKGELDFCDTLSFSEPTIAIGDYAFDGLISFGENRETELILPEGLLHIGKGAFRNCDSLTRVYIPKTVSEIDYLAFAGCSKLTEFEIDSENPYFTADNGIIYSKDKSELIFCLPQASGEIKLPASVDKINAFAFAKCYDITAIRIPSGVDIIEEFAIGYYYGGAERYIMIDQIVAGKVDRSDLDYPAAQAVKLICVENSAAWEYAVSHRLPFELMADCAHRYTSKTVAPSCTLGGYTLHTCSLCGDSYKTDPTPALSHSFSAEYTVDKYPTCSAAGQISRHCERCGEKTDITEVQKAAHTPGRYETVKAPTCESEGKTNEYCGVCDELIREIIVPAAHRFGLWHWIISPSNRNSGVKAHCCLDCGASETVMADTLDNKGDLNDDMAINVKDIIAMKKIIIGLRDYIPVADMSGDNLCTAFDLVYLRKYILGIR